jgi:hypothetical protein
MDKYNMLFYNNLRLNYPEKKTSNRLSVGKRSFLLEYEKQFELSYVRPLMNMD